MIGGEINKRWEGDSERWMSDKRSRREMIKVGGGERKEREDRERGREKMWTVKEMEVEESKIEGYRAQCDKERKRGGRE